jgi:hypothetical protein
MGWCDASSLAGLPEDQIDIHCAGQPSKSNASPCRCKGLSSTDTECLKRGRRGSNPQPPDRQDAGAAQNRPQKSASSACNVPNATTNATTAATSDAESDDRLLKLIQAWTRLTRARQRMIEAIVKTSKQMS